MAEVKSRQKPTDSYLAKNDPRASHKWPSDNKMPPVLMFKRKAIRVFPDNRRVALYYAQAIDQYLSIPFGKDKAREIPSLNEARKPYDPKDAGPAITSRSQLHDYLKAQQEQESKPDDKKSLYDHTHYARDLMYIARNKYKKSARHQAEVKKATIKAQEFEKNIDARLQHHIKTKGHDHHVDGTIKQITKAQASAQREAEYRDKREQVKKQDPFFQIGWHGADLAVKSVKGAAKLGKVTASAIWKGVQSAHSKFQEKQKQQAGVASPLKVDAPPANGNIKASEAVPQKKNAGMKQVKGGGDLSKVPPVSDRFSPSGQAKMKEIRKGWPKASDVLRKNINEVAPILPILGMAARTLGTAAASGAARAGASAVASGAARAGGGGATKSAAQRYLNNKLAQGAGGNSGVVPGSSAARRALLKRQLARRKNGRGGSAGIATGGASSLQDRLRGGGSGGLDLNNAVSRQGAPSFASDLFIRNPVNTSTSLDGSRRNRQ